jgi:hypothetical protein
VNDFTKVRFICGIFYLLKYIAITEQCEKQKELKEAYTISEPEVN